jgi:hypothetical protein
MRRCTVLNRGQHESRDIGGNAAFCARASRHACVHSHRDNTIDHRRCRRWSLTVTSIESTRISIRLNASWSGIAPTLSPRTSYTRNQSRSLSVDSRSNELVSRLAMIVDNIPECSALLGQLSTNKAHPAKLLERMQHNSRVRCSARSMHHRPRAGTC